MCDFRDAKFMTAILALHLAAGKFGLKSIIGLAMRALKVNHGMSLDASSRRT